MTSISAELNRINKLEYLDSMSPLDLAYWLIETFTPHRYRAGEKDVVEYAVRRLYEINPDTLLAVEFFNRLWGMHGLEPDYAPWMHQNVVKLERR